MLILQQEMTMFEHQTLETASEILDDEQIELVAGGFDGTGNIPICPPWFPGRPGGGLARSMSASPSSSRSSSNDRYQHAQ